MSVAKSNIAGLLIVLKLLLVGLLSVSCGQSPVRHASHGSNVRTKDQGNLYIHSSKGWQGPITIKLHTGASAEIEDGLQAAIGLWNEAVDHDIITYGGRSHMDRGADLYDSLTDNETVVYAETNWQQTTGKSTDILGTAIWENLPQDTSTIHKGDIILNAETYLFADAKNSTMAGIKNLADAESVLVHEIGHLIGLNHVDQAKDPYSIMAAYATVGFMQSHRQLSTGDLGRIRTVYHR